MAILAENRKARFDYKFLDTFEAGVSLLGHEVKSIRAGRMNLSGSFAVQKEGEIWLLNADIPPFQPKNTPSEYDSKRSRKLLLAKKEINALLGRTHSTSLTIIPIKVYSKRGLIKIEIALAKPKKKHDKRDVIRKRDVKKEIERTLKFR